MKNSVFCILTFLLGLYFPTQIFAQNSDSGNMHDSNSKLRHVVLFAFNDDASEADIRRIEEEFSALPGKIPQILDYEWGTNNSPEGLNDGLTHCFLVTFASEADRAVYLPHPQHQAFVKLLQPHLKKAVVVDYWANDQ